MMFDNTPAPEPKKWETLKDHLPILLVVGGALAAFIGLHTAAAAVAVVAGGHVLLGLIALVVVRLRAKSPEAAQQ